LLLTLFSAGSGKSCLHWEAVMNFQTGIITPRALKSAGGAENTDNASTAARAGQNAFFGRTSRKRSTARQESAER